MHTVQPIYTEKARCQDCYRCVRNCPVKAIKIDRGVASVVEELCIHCGKCVNSCPAGAKKVRNDGEIVRAMIDENEKVIVSLAPSYVAEFPGMTEAVLVRALKRIGFFGVSETALGAQEVSAHAAALVNKTDGNTTWISTACPSVVKYIRKYHPELAKYLTPLLSPLLAHCRMLKNRFPGARVVFFGPCIAKKNEAASHPDLCDAALTFEDLRKMLDEKPQEGHREDTVEDRDRFIPEKALDGVLYPVDGGMITGIRNNCTVTDRCAMHFSGMDEVASVIWSLERENRAYPVFLELLACPGGCVNGPMTANASGTLAKRLAIIGAAGSDGQYVQRTPSINIQAEFPCEPGMVRQFTDDATEAVLKTTGKYSPKDELNCGGCGYGNCREFARAVLSGNAETSMCVTYMRQLALKKANKLISAMPSGVVIVGSDLAIIECNERFAELAGGDCPAVYNQVPGMQGALLDKVLPVAHLFRNVFNGDGEITGKEIRIGNRVVRCSIFSIEPSLIAGGIFSDITDPELKKEEIVKRAQTVIRNNLTTVQKIAYLLGENASETEMVLSSIIDSYKHGSLRDDRLR
jgi:iron only hydrogenase large subunit-like protein